MSPYIKFKSTEIPFPEKITVVLPFDDAETLTECRAKSEEQTNFNSYDEAKLCTLSYAASELARYLRLIGNKEVVFKSHTPEKDTFNIIIDCGSAPKSDCAYFLKEYKNGCVELYGNGRVGALYSVFDFLRAQGVRWYYPGPEGECVPQNLSVLTLPTETLECKPSMSDGRGLDIFAPLKDSAQFSLWMARNRMNITAEHGYSLAFCNKIGMTFRHVGHMFEPLLAPDLVLPEGKTIWESHQEWYGLPPSGERIKRAALRNQFCVSSESLCDYLADALIGRLRGEWKNVDRVDIWGFDNNGGTSCHCEGCKKLGNDSDRALYFLSELRRRIDKAEDVKNVTLVACAYEGTKTIEAPTKPIPENLFAHDCVVFYPIHRCYYHDFDDESCTENSFFMTHIRNWMKQEPHLPFIMGEYYNVSKYEDLPLVFAERMKREIPFYVECGFSSITYMHPPLYNWGVRAVNHMLMAELSWDANADAEALISEYYERLYGKYADDAREIYELTEKGGAHIANYRNWWFSILHSLLHEWREEKPEKRLNLTGHFKDENELIEVMSYELEMRKSALRETERVIRALKAEGKVQQSTEVAQTPEEARLEQRGDIIMSRMYELRRSFIYASDELTLMLLLVRYHELLREDKSGDELWDEIEEVYDKMAGYFYPHRYISREVEAFCEDALTRSQMKAVVDLRRNYRNKRKENTK